MQRAAADHRIQPVFDHIDEAIIETDIYVGVAPPKLRDDRQQETVASLTGSEGTDSRYLTQVKLESRFCLTASPATIADTTSVWIDQFRNLLQHRETEMPNAISGYSSEQTSARCSVVYRLGETDGKLLMPVPGASRTCRNLRARIPKGVLKTLLILEAASG
ncbi:hypothetical protein AOG23_23430 [Rhizobium acidisoli]|nr:hypothetical protein AOG23_23430 [Rhizobium acidisoli]